VDIGTTSLKAALITAEGEVVSFCSLPFEASQDRFVAVSWYACLVKALGILSSSLNLNGLGLEPSAPIQISAIAISGNGPTVVTDCGLTFLWNEDTSAVMKDLPASARSSLFIPKILSVKNQFPQIWKKTKRLFSGPEYLIYILTGNALTILPEARFAPAYWSEESCRACGIKSGLLPPFVATGANCGSVNAELFEELEAALSGERATSSGTQESGPQLCLSPDCPVFAGGPDFVVALIGTGTLESGMLCDRCGSSEGLNFCTDRPISGEGLRTLPSVIPGLWNLSYLIPQSGSMSDQERLGQLEKGLELLRTAAAANGIEFAESMAVTGGQSNDELLLKEKNERLGMKLLLPASRHFVHSELLGDACAAFTGLGLYSSLQEAAKKIVRLTTYENI